MLNVAVSAMRDAPRRSGRAVDMARRRGSKPDARGRSTRRTSIAMAPSDAARIIASSRPAEEEGGQPPPPVADEDVDAARLRERARDLGERERAAEREEAARDPDRDERQGPGQLVGDAGRRAEDSGADRGADDDGDGAPEAELALEGERLGRGRRSGTSGRAAGSGTESRGARSGFAA